MNQLPTKNSRQRRQASETILFEHAANNGGMMHWKDVVELCGYTQTYAIQMLKEMSEAGQVHICKWVHIGKSGPRSPVYMVGQGKDAPRPKAKTQAQKCKDYRKRQKKYQQELARTAAKEAEAAKKAEEKAKAEAMRLMQKEAREKLARDRRAARMAFEAMQRAEKKAKKEEEARIAQARREKKIASRPVKNESTAMNSWEENELARKKREELERLMTAPPFDPLLMAMMGKKIPSCHVQVI